MGSTTRPIYWAHTWDSFAVELTALVALHVDANRSHSSEDRYVCRILTAPNCRMNAPEHIDADSVGAHAELQGRWRTWLVLLLVLCCASSSCVYLYVGQGGRHAIVVCVAAI